MVKAQKHMNAEEVMSARRNGGELDKKKNEWIRRIRLGLRARLLALTSWAEIMESQILIFQVYPSEHNPRVGPNGDTRRPYAKMAWEVEGLIGIEGKRKYLCSHRDHCHDTNDCFNLNEQIEEMIQQGRLRRFVIGQKENNTSQL